MYKKRYQCLCKSVDGSTYRIEIYKKGFNGSAMEVRLAGDMITIERRAGSQLEPITISTARLSLYTEQDGVFEDLYSPEEHGALVRIYKDNSLYYVGSLDREQWSAPYSFEKGYITEISFSDLAPLKFLPFKEYGLVSVIDLIKDAVTKSVYPDGLGGAPFFSNLFNIKVTTFRHEWLRVIDDDYIANISSISSFERLKIADGSLKHLNPTEEKTSLHNAYIDTRVFHDKDDNRDESVWWNALNELLKATGLYLMQRNGKFFLYDIDALVERGEKENLVPKSTDAELSIEPVKTKAIVEVDKKENTELFRHKNVEADFGNKLLEWSFNRIDTEADREVLANKVEFYAPKTDTVIRGGAVYCNVTPHTAGSSDICVCAYAKPRNEYWHKPLIGGTIRHTLAHTTAFSTPYPLPKFADINNMKGDDGVYCTPVIPIPARTTEIMAKYQLALSLKFMLRADYSLAQENKADPDFDRVIGKHIKKITPKKIEHVYLWARIRALDEKGQVVAHLSNYGSTPDFLDPFLRPAWVDDNLPCLIEFGAENFGLGTFQAPNEQIARYDFASVYGEVYDKRFIFPLPPKGVAIEVVITDRFDILVKDPRKYGSLPYEQLQQAEDAEMARILRESYIQWVMMKDLGVDLVSYDGRDYEHKKIEYKTSNSSTTHELVEEKILLDTSDLLSPTSLSALKDREGRNLAPKCSRGFASGTLGELRIAHLMARSSGRHYRLSGTYKTPASFGCLVDPHKKTLYRVVEERERVLDGKSELALVEINRESISLVSGDISVIGIGDRDFSIAHQFEDRIVGGEKYYKEAGRFGELVTVSALDKEIGAVSEDLFSIQETFNSDLNRTVSAVFTARKSELKGKDGAGAHKNLLKGYRGTVIHFTGATAYEYRVLVPEKFLQSGKNYLVVADYTCTSEKKPDFITLFDYFVTVLRSDTIYTGNPTRVALFVPASDRSMGTRGVLGYSGKAGNALNVSSEYSNIMLLEWGDSWDGVIPPYFPHVDDLKVTADEVSASLIASNDFKANLSATTAQILNADSVFKASVKGEKGDKGEQGVNGVDGTSVTLADLNIRWNGTSLVVAGVESGSLKGAKGADGKSVTIADLKANASFMQHTAREVAKFGEFATTEQLSKELLHLKREFREVERVGYDPYTVVLESPELHEEGKIVEVSFIESNICQDNDGRIQHAGEIYTSELKTIAKEDGFVLPPNRTACYHNHFVFKVVKYRGQKVWQWENYEMLKVSETTQKVVEHGLSIENTEQEVTLLQGQVRNLQSKEIDNNNHLVEQGAKINTLMQKSNRLEQDVNTLKIGKHKITVKSLRNASIVPEPLNTLQMTHSTTANSLYLPSPSEGLCFRLWANHWVDRTITIRKPSFPSNNFLINTATNTQISSLTLIAGHLYDFVAVNGETWLVTDLSR